MKIRIIVKVEKFLAKFTRVLVVTGRQVATDLLARKIGEPNQFVSIPGISQIIDVFPRDRARRNLGLDSQFTIIWAARVVPVKNPQLLVEVARLMPDCQFIMMGDGILLDSIRSVAPSNLKILGFTAVNEVLLAGDVFLSTSLNEGIPYSILEAKSVGLPVVAVQVGALPDLIRHEMDGYLVAPNAPEIVARLVEIRGNPKLIEQIKSRLGPFDIETNGKFCERHLEIYKNICQ
jgi:glycosyltransferase involved in cell wall biosynthesis